ncbi:MAG: flagellar assembly protein FliW [Anaerolineae bacterium]
MVEQEEVVAALGAKSAPIEFPDGLIGMDEWHQFEIISHPAGGSLRLLQSLEDPRMSLILMPPLEILPDYRLLLAEGDASKLKYSGGSGPLPADSADISVYCILSIQEEPFLVTANLLGPLVINWATGLGVQVIASDSNYNPRHPLVSGSQPQETPDAATQREA